MRLTPHKEFPLRAENTETLELVIRTAFNQRRKTLKNSLKAIMSEDSMVASGIDFSLRPETLSLADYVRLSDAISAAGE